MVAIVLIHTVQVFLFGAYKYPRELTWIVGVLLLRVTLGMAFTGQVLRFDQNWGLGIGASIVSHVPIADRVCCRASSDGYKARHQLSGRCPGASCAERATCGNTTSSSAARGPGLMEVAS
jgi:Cytochrome b(N-terminal)/b6/petB